MTENTRSSLLTAQLLVRTSLCGLERVAELAFMKLALFFLGQGRGAFETSEITYKSLIMTEFYALIVSHIHSS